MLLTLALWAHADQLVEGDALRIYFDSTGTWNDQDAGRGIQALHDGNWFDWTYYGYAWQMLAFDYSFDDGREAFYANSHTATATCTVTGEADRSTDAWQIAGYSFDTDEITVAQTQAWAKAGREIRVTHTVTAIEQINGLRLYFEVDPDPDGALGVYTTENDVIDSDGDGVGDLAVSVSSAYGYTLAFGACAPDDQVLGHNANWSSGYTASVSLTDDAGVAGDAGMGIRYVTDADIDPGESLELSFVVIEADSLEAAIEAWGATTLCGSCDDDGDGHGAGWCGGDDCDDADPDVYTGATEVWYDGVDGDCDGADDNDQDGDGFGLDDDCDDTNPAAYPGGAEVLYDGIDGDCDGASDFDADGDGYDTDDYGGDDCNDNDGGINPAAVEVFYDDVDQNCDGNDDDADGDGFDSPADCDDTNGDVYPGAYGANGDGVDSDCDGSDDDAQADPGELKISGGCGCASSPNAAWAGLLVAAWIRRRPR